MSDAIGGWAGPVRPGATHQLACRVLDAHDPLANSVPLCQLLAERACFLFEVLDHHALQALHVLMQGCVCLEAGQI